MDGRTDGRTGRFNIYLTLTLILPLSWGISDEMLSTLSSRRNGLHLSACYTQPWTACDYCVCCVVSVLICILYDGNYPTISIYLYFNFLFGRVLNSSFKSDQWISVWLRLRQLGDIHILFLRQLMLKKANFWRSCHFKLKLNAKLWQNHWINKKNAWEEMSRFAWYVSILYQYRSHR